MAQERRARLALDGYRRLGTVVSWRKFAAHVGEGLGPSRGEIFMRALLNGSERWMRGDGGALIAWLPTGSRGHLNFG
jgi:hypothetical protein